MFITAADGNGADGPGRAQVLAGAAADAQGRVDGRDAHAALRVLDHGDRPDGAMAGAVAAACAVLRDTEGAVDAGRADMVAGLFLLGNGADGAAGADFAAGGAFWPAVAALEGHLRLHEMIEVRGRPQDVVRALRHAELAGGAATVEVLDAPRSGGRDGDFALRNGLVLDRGESAVRLLLLGLHGRGADHEGRTGEESPAPLVGTGFRPAGALPGEAVFQGAEAAGFDAVETADAAAVVDRVAAEVDAGSLAGALAGLAILALVLVEHRAEHRKSGQEAERGPHGADVVAVVAASAPGENRHDDKRHGRHDQRRKAAEPHGTLIEGIAAGPLSRGGEVVVDPQDHRLEDALDDASPGAVGRKDSRQGLYADKKQYHPQRPDAVAEPLVLLFKMIRPAVLAGAVVQGGNPVLEHAERADDRTVYPAEKEGQKDQKQDDADVGGHHGGQELDFGHPAQPQVQRPGKVQQQKGDAGPQEHRKKDPEFFKHLSKPSVVLTNIITFRFQDKNDYLCLNEHVQPINSIDYAGHPAAFRHHRFLGDPSDRPGISPSVRRQEDSRAHARPRQGRQELPRGHERSRGRDQGSRQGKGFRQERIVRGIPRRRNVLLGPCRSAEGRHSPLRGLYPCAFRRRVLLQGPALRRCRPAPDQARFLALPPAGRRPQHRPHQHRHRRPVLHPHQGDPSHRAGRRFPPDLLRDLAFCRAGAV